MNSSQRTSIAEMFKRRDAGICPFCGTEIKDCDFRNELSRRESKISGLCQSCQDDIFVEG